MDMEHIYDELNFYAKDQGFCMAKTTYQNIVFEERVLLSCYYCSKYYKQWTCGERLPKHIRYRDVLKECEHLSFVYASYLLEGNIYENVRHNSSNDLHKVLLGLETVLYKNNVPLALSFLGGSCKLCKTGCGENSCNNPGKARIPIEAIGINVIKSAGNSGINICFPPNSEIKRIGLLAW